MGEVKRKPRKWTQREIKKVIEMYHDGMNMNEIGREIGRDGSVVRVKLQALGIKSNKKMLWDIESLRPHIINIDEAKQTTAQSNKKLLFKCSSDDCDNTKMMMVHNLVNKGFFCQNCSTGTSYPELFFIAVNEHFKLNFKYQQTYENGRFDFINHDIKVVVEMNGIAHYEDKGYMNHKVTKLSDDKKRKWCKENGYTLIFIDARKSDFKFIQDNINKCKLLPTITDEDIPILVELINKYSKYPVKEIIDMYLKARKTTYQIAEHYGYGHMTINNILTRNNIELRDKGSAKMVRCIETGIVYASTMEAGRKLEINNSNISAVCKGKYNSAGGYHWEFLSNTEENAMHRASLVSQQDKLDTIELDSSDHMLDLFNKNKEKV